MLTLTLTLAVLSQTPSWKQIDDLAGQQKVEAAAKAVETRLAAARKSGDEADAAKALVRLTQYRLALGGWETAVNRLREEAWPRASLPRASVELFYAHALATYVRAYSWEIQKRERVDTKGKLDLKAWTKEQLLAEAQRSWEEVWKRRDGLGTQPLGALKDTLSPNDYPRGIRDTLRDAVTYLRVAALVDSSGWTPEQSNGLYKLDLEALAKGDPAASAKLDLTSDAEHPLRRALALLDDLEAWHRKAGRREAALEARLQRLEVLWTAFTDAGPRARLAPHLEQAVSAGQGLAWSSMARAQLAHWREAAGDLPAARAIALEGAKAFPDSVGGKRCRHLVARIESPDFTLAAMQADGLERRSVEVTHKNLEKLYFRAWPLDFERDVLRRNDYQILPERQQLKATLAQPPAHAWSVDLPPTPDYRAHRTSVVPPLKKRGLWLVAAPLRADFKDQENRIQAVPILFSRLVTAVRRDSTSGTVDVAVLDGDTGAPVQGAKVQVWSFGYSRTRVAVEDKVTGASGQVRFGPKDLNSQYFVTAFQGGDWALEAQGIYFWASRPSAANGTLVFTDRSVYRPEQRVQWKVVAYQGNAERTKFDAWAGASFDVQLMDPNWQVVEKLTVKTNRFGAASGEFKVPRGRLLGQWQVHTPWGSSAVRVEEYKRPTFEAKFAETQAPARLGSPVELKGEARYYFGLPVASGKVAWRVKRTATYPWWWWWGFGASNRDQVVASGTAPLEPDGSFRVGFTPEADPEQPKEVTYTYQVEADVTDDGGETRSASRVFRLGWVAVEARVVAEQAFFVEGEPAALQLKRTDLDGQGRAGPGTWRVLGLVGPAKTPLPSDLPLARAPGEKPKAVETPGDRLRSRWAQGYSADAELRTWADGAEVARGEVAHGADGLAQVTLPRLAPGAYRLRYATKDEFGAPYEMWKDVLVAGRQGGPSLPAVFRLERSAAAVGEKVRLWAASGYPGQKVLFTRYRGGRPLESRWLEVGKDAPLLELPVGPEDRGGFGVSLAMVRDYAPISYAASVQVPWDDKALKLEFATFRDTLRPGAKETFRVTVKGKEGALAAGAAEVLAYMYDQSLDFFAPHTPPSAAQLYAHRGGAAAAEYSLGSGPVHWLTEKAWFSLPQFPSLRQDAFVGVDGYGLGGLGVRGMGRGGGGISRNGHGTVDFSGDTVEGELAASPALQMKRLVPSSEPALQGAPGKSAGLVAREAVPASPAPPPPPPPPGEAAPVQVRSNFAETAFWQPALLLDAQGAAVLEFQVPDSVTAWNVWAHAVTRDLRGGSVKATTRSVKDLMVRPYLPRFLREGDQAAIKVQVNNASKKPLSGELRFELLDPDTGASVAAEFGLQAQGPQPFSAKPGEAATLTFPLKAPKRVGQVHVKVTAKAQDVSDGELRPLPLLPSRMRLAQSKFATLKDKDSRVLELADLAKQDDPTRIHERLVVTVDAQLFYSVLGALPYLVRYPYECTEQTLNRFLSSAIVTSVFKDHPAVAKMAKELARQRQGPLESFDGLDANRKLALEESPWLLEAKGGKHPLGTDSYLAVLDPEVAAAERASALAKLQKAQVPDGGFPWWPGGPPSPWMTLYLVHGFGKAMEFKSEVPQDMVRRAWSYLAGHYRADLRRCLASNDCGYEFVTFLNYTASMFPEAVVRGLTAADRKEMLDFSFRHRKRLPPLAKGYLALTLHRMGRSADAQSVFAVVMDSAKTTADEGTFWAPEDRAWLWYNDTIETHAFALRVMTELLPKDERRAGLVQWLLLNKKLGHWKSTRATAEVLYSLVKYLQAEGALGVREESRVEVGPVQRTFVFEPDVYSGAKNQVVIDGPDVTPAMSKVRVSKDTRGFQFASVTWHYSTDQLPKEARGDLFRVTRAWFKRVKQGTQVVLQPLGEGARLEPGDEVEVQLSVRSRMPAEYVHLRDPRAAGLEPDRPVSRFKWDLGLGWYEEYRDSATNFFFEALPPGEYTLRYRLRVAMGGTFRVGPATLQSMYAPEFTAFSQGGVLEVGTGGR